MSFVAGTDNQFVVTYNFSPPTGQWAPADTGTWAVELGANQVGEYASVPLYAPAGVEANFIVTSKWS
jgi:hypothetical protein